MLAIDAHEARQRAAYWRAGLIASTVINVNKTKGRRAKPEDFVPKKKRAAAQTATQMAAKLKALTLAMGGSVRVRP